MDDKFESDVEFGLVVEGFFEELVIAFFIEVDEVGIGTGNGGSLVIEGKELGFGDKGLENGRSEDDFHFFLNVFPKLVEIHY